MPGHGEVLGQHHQRRTGRGRSADQHRGAIEVGLGVGARRRLDGRDAMTQGRSLFGHNDQQSPLAAVAGNPSNT